MGGGTTTQALGLTAIAASGTALGGFIVVMFPHFTYRGLGILSGLAAGLMLGITFLDLMPETIASIGFNDANLSFYAGVAFFALAAHMVPESTFERFFLEDSHFKTSPKKEKALRQRKILVAGLVTAFGIALHNFPEGFAVFLAAKKSKKLGLNLALAMTLHNIPEGVAVALPIYFATKSKAKAFKIAAISGLAEPLAVVLAALFFPSAIEQRKVDLMLAAVAGIMAYLVMNELLPLAMEHVDVKTAVASLFGGMMLMSAMLALMNEAIGEDL